MNLRALFLIGGLAGCSSPAGPSTPSAPHFEVPVDLGPPVSTDGWEDSGFISPNGQFFYFTYLRIDPLRYIRDGTVVVSGPLRPEWDPADTVAAKLYRTELVSGAWTEPQSLGPMINRRNALNGDEWVSEDGLRILFTDPVVQPGRPEPGIYYAEQQNGVWSDPVLARTIGFPFVSGDENPHLTLDERTLFFESSRAGGYGGPDLWMSVIGSAGWSTPQNLGSVVNTSGVEGSPFSLDGREALLRR